MEKGVGVICECNPLHNGHLALFHRVKKRFPEKPLILVMSGNFVQRGEAAAVEKYARAEALVKSGADLVLEIPFPFSALSAERFAAAGVHILEKTGLVSHIAFGCESADEKELFTAAERLSSPAFQAAFAAARAADKKTGFPALRERVYTSLYGENELLRLPNASLALEYLCALKREKSAIEPVSFLRKESKNVASASAIRLLLKNGDWEAVKPLVPAASFEALSRAKKQEKLILSQDALFPLIGYVFRMKSKEELASFYGVEAVADRTLAALNTAKDYGELCALVATSRHTDSRIRRAFLAAVAGIPKEADSVLPEWTLVLAAGKKGRALLAETRDSSFPVFTKPGHTRRNSAAKRGYEYERKIETALFSFLSPARLPLPLTPFVADEKI